MAVEHSRGLRLGAEATGRSESELEAALEASRVVVSVDPAMPLAQVTARVLLTTLRCGPGILVLERNDLARHGVEELIAAVNAVDPDRALKVVRTWRGDATVRLHLGPAHDHAIRLVPDGFGAHVAGHRLAVIHPTRPGNGVGAVFTAALGAAEAFKLTARVLPDRRVLHRHMRFCPLSLSSDLAAAPDLPDDLVFELALVGVGAIGTGIALLLDVIGARGRLLAVDFQRFSQENRGTYSLGTEIDALAAPWKVDLARAALPRFDVIPFTEPAEHLLEATDAGSIPWFRTVMTALDSPEARRSAQRLWPDRLIDAGTGDTMLGIHDHEFGSGPCMICVFPPNREGPSGAQRLAAATGLSVARLVRGDDPLTEGDLGGLSVEQRRRLEPHLGKPVCGLAQEMLTDLDASGYRPSIPFVSLQAACLAVARLLAVRIGAPVTNNLVQYHALVGPQAATIDRMDMAPGCHCQTRAASIEQVRAIRAGRLA